MSSGISVDDACITAFQDLKLRKKYQYILYRLSDDLATIVIEKAVEDKGTSYDDFVAQLPDNDCRYAVYDFEFEKPGEGTRNKICFYVWAPDTAKVRQKMVYASSKDALRKKLVGIATEIQATDYAEVSHASVLDRVASF